MSSLGGGKCDNEEELDQQQTLVTENGLVKQTIADKKVPIKQPQTQGKTSLEEEPKEEMAMVSKRRLDRCDRRSNIPINDNITNNNSNSVGNGAAMDHTRVDREQQRPAMKRSRLNDSNNCGQQQHQGNVADEKRSLPALPQKKQGGMVYEPMTPGRNPPLVRGVGAQGESSVILTPSAASGRSRSPPTNISYMPRSGSEGSCSSIGNLTASSSFGLPPPVPPSTPASVVTIRNIYNFAQDGIATPRPALLDDSYEDSNNTKIEQPYFDIKYSTLVTTNTAPGDATTTYSSVAATKDVAAMTGKVTPRLPQRRQQQQQARPPPSKATTEIFDNRLPATVKNNTDDNATGAAPSATTPAAASLVAAQEAKTPREPTTGTGSTRGRLQGPGLIDDFTDWQVGSRYELVRILGRGSYGEVAQARDLYTGPYGQKNRERDRLLLQRKERNNQNQQSNLERQDDSLNDPNNNDQQLKQEQDQQKESYQCVAIKRITSAFEQEVDAIRLYREIHILRQLRGHCEFIIQLLNVIQPPSENLDDFHELYLVFEYVDTDLYKLIMSPQYLTTEHIQTFLYQMLAGLKYIHSSSVIHRDLKPANILLNEDCSLKICDFGLARIVNSSHMSSSAIGGDSNKPSSTVVDTNLGLPSPPGGRLTRQLTKHVVTRWYRAPELILIQTYTSAVDIWSLGCILAELLSMQEGNVLSYGDRVPLFPGGSCYPLSGEGGSVRKDERLDQLSVIFGVIGTPDQEDIDSIGNANDYLKTLEKKKGRPLESLYPAADPSAIDLLKRMLQFNPKKRCTAAEALDHEFFSGVRNKEMEVSAMEPLIGPEFLETQDVDLRTLKRKTYEEVLWYRDHT